MTTPNHLLPYPSPDDPVAEGADAIRALAERVDVLMIAVQAGSPLSGALPATPAPYRLLAGTAVVTTNGASAFAMMIDPPAANALLTESTTPGDDQGGWSIVQTFDYHLNYYQGFYFRNGQGVVNAGVRINYLIVVI